VRWGLLALLACGCGRLGIENQPDARSSSSGIQRVQLATPGFVHATSMTIPVTLSPDDLAVVGVYWNQMTDPVTVGDTAGIAWQGGVEQAIDVGCNAGRGTQARLWYASVTAAGSDEITVAQGTSTTPLGVYFADYSGVDPASPLAAQTGAIASANPSNTMSAGTLTTPRDAVIVALFNDSNGTGVMVPGADFALIGIDTSFFSMLEEQLASSGTYGVDGALPVGRADSCWVATAAAFAAR
jgi:hypothetical protein